MRLRLGGGLSGLRAQMGLTTLTLALGQALSAIFMLLVAGKLGDSGFGLLVLTTIIMAVTVSIIDFGQSNRLIRDLASHRTSIGEELGAAISRAMVILLSSGVAAAILFSIADVEPSWLVLYGFATWLGITTSSMLRGLGKPILSAFALTVDKAIALFSGVLVTTWSVDTAIRILGISTGFAAVVFCVYIVHTARNVPIARRRPPYFGGLAFGLGNLATNLSRLNPAVVAAVMPLTAVGTYALATRVTSPVVLLIGSMSFVLLPHFSASSGMGGRAVVRRSMPVFLLVSLASMGLALFASPLLFGLGNLQGFHGFSMTLAVLCVGLPFASLAAVWRAFLLGCRQESFVAVNTWITTGLGLVLTVILGSALGVVGAAVAFPISQVISAAHLYPQVRAVEASEH